MKTSKYKFDLRMPYCRDFSGDESEAALHLFEKFLANGFSYDSMSSHPEYMNYASAEYLMVLLPEVIDQMLRRNDTINYLVYPVVAAIDPVHPIVDYRERGKKVLALADGSFTQKVLSLLNELKTNPPLSEGAMDRLLSIWKENF